MIPGPASPMPALGVEDAVITIQNQIINQFNANLDTVYKQWQPYDGTAMRNMPFLTPEQIFITEAVDPLSCPAVFIVPDLTDDNNDAQNFVFQVHKMLVGILLEDVESSTLARLTWRYVSAMYLTLHDQALGNLKCIVESRDYGPIFRKTKGDGRQFRKDATLRIKVLHLERF